MNREQIRAFGVVATQMHQCRREKVSTYEVTAHLGADDLDRVLALMVEQLADITAEQRRKYARTGVARKDGSFPVPDCEYAEKAIRAQGRAKPEDREAVRKHIVKRVRALRCSGEIFDDYK